MSYLENKRLCFALWMTIVISAFAVIYSSFSARTAFIAWQSLLHEARQYDVEWGQLLIEKSTMASYARLEGIAADQLQMTAPDKSQVIVVEGSL